MADVSSACDVVSSRFEACPPERALRTLCAFVSRREREDSSKAGQNALNQKVGGETLDGHGSGGSHVVGSAGQLRLVRDSLVAQLGGMDSEVCRRAFKEAKETERKQTSLSAGRVNSVDQDQNPTFELEMGIKTVAGLVAERIAEKRKRKKDKKEKKKTKKKKRKKDE